MIILGLNYGIHDSAAAVLADSKLVAAAEEERFDRIKHTKAFPAQAIRYGLKAAGCTLADVDHVAIAWDHSIGWDKRWRAYIERALQRLPDAEAAMAYLKKTYEEKATWLDNHMDIRKLLGAAFRGKVHFINHHFCHAASCFHVSPFEEATILVMDGAGEEFCTSIYTGRGTDLGLVKHIDIPDSLGAYYGAVTQFLGFTHHDEEWKVMGWAPYGQPVFRKKIDQLIHRGGENLYGLNLKYFQHHLGKFPWYAEALLDLLDLKPRHKDDDFPQVYADVAASAQALLADVVLDIARFCRANVPGDKLCMAGGVALNGMANGEILREGIYQDLYIQAAANDGGTALGAALYVDQVVLGRPRTEPMPHAFLGPEYSDDEVETALRKYPGIAWQRLERPALLDRTARALADGQVTGWHQGRMEFGPRALGSRSILADPRRADMKALINSKIKFREPFRPFAPSVIAEKAEQYFAGCRESRFMNVIFNVVEDKRRVIPAVTHVDGSARVQTVERPHAPLYYELLERFEALTGVPVLLNTSFNVKGEPIVCTPEDSINCFVRTGLDVLVIGSFFVEKR